jgi:hypothetical protein
VSVEPGERQDVGERGPVTVALEMGGDGDAGAAHRVAALAADGDNGQLAGMLRDLLGREANRVRVERPGESAVAGHEHDQALAALAPGEQRMLLRAEDRGEVGEDLVDLFAVGPRVERRLLRAAELRGGNELHRPRDLANVPDRAYAAPDVSLTSQRLATSTLVQLLTHRGRRRSSATPSVRGLRGDALRAIGPRFMQETFPGRT